MPYQTPSASQFTRFVRDVAIVNGSLAIAGVPSKAGVIAPNSGGYVAGVFTAPVNTENYLPTPVPPAPPAPGPPEPPTPPSEIIDLDLNLIKQSLPVTFSVSTLNPKFRITNLVNYVPGEATNGLGFRIDTATNPIVSEVSFNPGPSNPGLTQEEIKGVMFISVTFPAGDLNINDILTLNLTESTTDITISGIRDGLIPQPSQTIKLDFSGEQQSKTVSFTENLTEFSFQFLNFFDYTSADSIRLTTYNGFDFKTLSYSFTNGPVGDYITESRVDNFQLNFSNATGFSSNTLMNIKLATPIGIGTQLDIYINTL